VRVLGDVPFLGRLFKSTSYTDITTEIVFVLTPKVVTKKKASLQNLGFQIVDEKGMIMFENAKESNTTKVLPLKKQNNEQSTLTIPYEEEQ